MSRATSIGVRNWPRSARAPSSSAASPASRRPAASESRSTALGYRVCPAASGGRGRPLPSPGPESIAVSMRTAPGPDVSRGQGHRRVRAGCSGPRRSALPWPGAPGRSRPYWRATNPPAPRGRGGHGPVRHFEVCHQPSGSPWPGAPGSLCRGVYTSPWPGSIAAELVDPRRDVSAAWEHWSRPGASQGRPASFLALRELVGRGPSGCCASECPSHGVVLLDNAGAA